MDWKRLLSFRQSEVVGLDIGTSTVKMVRLRKDNGSYAVTAAAIADIVTDEGNGNRRGMNTIRAIRKCLEFTRVQTRFAVCSVCGPQVAVRDFKFPALSVEEIEEAVKLEAAQACPFNTKDGAVDYQLIPTEKDKTSGILVAATNDIIKNKIHLVKNALLECALVDVDGLALLNCFQACENRKLGEPAAILHIGSTHTNIAIIGGNNWPSIRDMPYAGNDIIKQVATENNLSIKTVKEILTSGSVEAYPELQGSLRDACHKLTADVTKTLRYYAAHGKTTLSDKMYICGGFALVDGIVKILNGQLPTGAVLWNPFEKIRCATGYDHQGILQKNILRKSGPALAVAAGLAMRSI